MVTVRLLRLLLGLLLFGCETGGACVDTDLDGYGPGCELGEDCDENNAARNVDCVGVPPPDCAADPTLTGCPCLPGGVQTCLDDGAGLGICLAGETVCVAGFWGLCEGGTGPRSERCDGVDDDCDGLVDEGVVSPCGGCTPGCLGGLWGEPPEPFVPEGDLTLTRRGELTLGFVERRFGAVWVANSAGGTLSRIDADEARETARYDTGGAEPSRVAVDYLGDAWVVNREFDGVASVTKVAGSEARCVDRDGDGLETSSGPTDVRPVDEDECVLLHVEVGEAGAVARAIAIDGDTGLDGASGGDAWIGLHDAEAIVELEGITGAQLRRVETPGFQPYAATFDRWGTLWMIARDGLLARIDVSPEEPIVEILEVPFACYLLYGLAADLEGRLLMTGFSCDRIFGYDPDVERFETRTLPPSPRAATFDGVDRFFVAHTAFAVSEVAFDPLRVRETWSVASETTVPFETIGVGVDVRGQVWTASTRGGEDGLGVASRLDPESGEVTAQVTVGEAPHVQGDLTGTRTSVVHAEVGSLTHVFEGCPAEAPTRWLRLHLSARAGGAGVVELEARHAATRAGLASASFATVGTVPGDEAQPWSLESVPEGGVLEVRLTLRVEGASGAPRVRRVGVEWRCPGPD